MTANRKQIRQIERKRRRGWIVSFLYETLPKPLEFASIIFLLDQKNFPLSIRRLSEELDYLRGLGFIRVFPHGTDKELSKIEQAKLLQRFADSDGELSDEYCAMLATKGVNFQEGNDHTSGIIRIN